MEGLVRTGENSQRRAEIRRRRDRTSRRVNLKTIGTFADCLPTLLLLRTAQGRHHHLLRSPPAKISPTAQRLPVPSPRRPHNRHTTAQTASWPHDSLALASRPPVVINRHPKPFFFLPSRSKLHFVLASQAALSRAHRGMASVMRAAAEAAADVPGPSRHGPTGRTFPHSISHRGPDHPSQQGQEPELDREKVPIDVLVVEPAIVALF